MSCEIHRIVKKSEYFHDTPIRVAVIVNSKQNEVTTFAPLARDMQRADPGGNLIAFFDSR